MSSLPEADEVVAVLCSDLHLDDKPPIFRSAEKNWLGVQEGYLEQLRFLAKSLNNAPIFCAGDIFNKWNPSPVLINFAIDFLPPMYAVPGQHDLRLHSLEDIQQTAYWTLCKSGIITNLKPGLPEKVGKVIAHGFPWGIDVWPCKEPPHTFGVHLAVVHQYVWTKNSGYHDAPEKARLVAFRQKLKGYDACVTGDNHTGFISHKEGECTVFNHGTFIIRNSNFRTYEPKVGLLHLSGKVSLHKLDTSNDKYLEDSKLLDAKEGPSLGDFLEGLTGLGDSVVDFAQALRIYMDTKNVSGSARKVIEEALGK